MKRKFVNVVCFVLLLVFFAGVQAYAESPWHQPHSALRLSITEGCPGFAVFETVPDFRANRPVFLHHSSVHLLYYRRDLSQRHIPGAVLSPVAPGIGHSLPPVQLVQQVQTRQTGGIGLAVFLMPCRRSTWKSSKCTINPANL